jgi:hypothetical protein
MGKQSDIMIKYSCAFREKIEKTGGEAWISVTVQVLV